VLFFWLVAVAAVVAVVVVQLFSAYFAVMYVAASGGPWVLDMLRPDEKKSELPSRGEKSWFGAAVVVITKSVCSRTPQNKQCDVCLSEWFSMDMIMICSLDFCCLVTYLLLRGVCAACLRVLEPTDEEMAQSADNVSLRGGDA